MRIEIELLGTINKTATAASPLQPRYILKVRAEQLAQWLQCERRGAGKNAPFKISKHSTIRIDESIQRGKDEAGYLLQNPRKVMEIANTLLTPAAAAIPRIYLGTLIWNVRPNPSVPASDLFDIQKIEIEGKPPTYRLAFDTDAIYLTDSAHRHLGIVQAFKQYSEAPADYKAFSPKWEFAVELHTLNKIHERELFSELNSKQKKITAAKKKEMDVSSPIGSLKDAIQDYDRMAERLFDKNIEVNSNQNVRHTLVTMSVFVASIDLMFPSREIKQAQNDDEAKADLSEYYCQFFYELANTLVVQVDYGNGDEDYRPFRNLYTDFIKPAEDDFDPSKPTDSEKKLEQARDRAKEENKKLREFDVANHNSFVKAFAMIGRHIRHMEHWKDVIARLHTTLNIPSGGKFFQKANSELFDITSLGVPIASLNENDTINIQVQTKTIRAVYNYFMDKLALARVPLVLLAGDDGNSEECLESSTTRVRVLEESATYYSAHLYFYLPRPVGDCEDGTVRLDIDGGTEWVKATKKNKTGGLQPTSLVIDDSYKDSDYQDIVRWRASFEIPWPEGSSMDGESAKVKLKFIYPKFEDPLSTDVTEREIEIVKSTS
jgi:hypothetical protein